MKYAITIYVLLSICIIVSGCGHLDRQVIEDNTITITRSYERQNNLSTSDAVDVIRKLLLARYRPRPSPTSCFVNCSIPGYLLFDTEEFNSIDEKGFRLAKVHTVYDSVDVQQALNRIGYSYHYETSVLPEILFADVSGIKLRKQILKFGAVGDEVPNVVVSLLFNDGRVFWFSTADINSPSPYRDILPQTDIALSAFLTLCPNVK